MVKRFKRSGFFGISLLWAVMFLAGAIGLNGLHQAAMAADDATLDSYKEIAKTMVHGTATTLGEGLKDVKAEQDRIDKVRAFITPIRFYADKSGYFYVYDLDCNCIAHATQPDLEGKNLNDYKDAKGDFAIRNLRDAAKKGGGFVEFYWVKPGSKEQSKKLGYVEPIPGTNYFIGSGVYLP
jgi:signal transduction histidine kinase